MRHCQILDGFNDLIRLVRLADVRIVGYRPSHSNRMVFEYLGKSDCDSFGTAVQRLLMFELSVSGPII